MANYTESLGLELITPGSQAGLWGNTTNNSLNLIDQAITGVTPVSFASASGTTYTLTDYNGSEDEARSAVLNVTGTAIGSNTIVIPNKQKTYFVRNNTGKDIIVQTPTATTPCTVGAGYNLPIFCDGNNNVFLAILAPGAGTLTVSGGGTGKTTFTAGFVKSPGGNTALTTASQVALGSEVSGTLPVANGGTGVTSFTSGAVLLGNGSGNLSTVTASTDGYLLTWDSSTSSWKARAPTTGGVNSISSTTIGVSPATGNVVLTLSGSNVTAALGYTPYNSTNPSGYISSSSGTAYDSARLGGVAASGYATTTALSSYMPKTGGTFTGDIFVQSGTTSKLSASSVQVGYSGVGVSASSAVQVALFNNGGGVLDITTTNLTFNGAAYKPGGGSWSATSDARLKTNSTPLTGALEKIASLNPVTYTWKYQTSEPTTGFIAQEVESVIPSAVSKTAPTDDQKPFIPDGEIYSLGWKNDIFAYLVGAIKELKAEVDALKAAK